MNLVQTVLAVLYRRCISECTLLVIDDIGKCSMHEKWMRKQKQKKSYECICVKYIVISMQKIKRKKGKEKKGKSKAIQQLYLGKVPLGGGGVAENKCKTLNGSKKRTHMNPIAPAHA